MTGAINYRGLSIPRMQLGTNVTSDNLFDPNEQVIFDFYQHNKDRYRRVLDIGANIGVHSILMARLGWQVRAFEPDPEHYEALLRNTAAHEAWVEAWGVAVSDRDGAAEFIRLLNNTTGSHLAGAKNSYGPADRIVVRTVDCRQHFAWADFAKIDCEGHEAVLICSTTFKTWRHMDAMLEVGSEESARAIYDHRLGMAPMWAQKIDWHRVAKFEDMPMCHQDGSLFVGRAAPFPGGGSR